MSQYAVNKRHSRPYAPDGLMVLRGPRGEYKPGSHWIVGDEHGYAEIIFMQDHEAYHKNTLYIEDIMIKEPLRDQGNGRALYEKIEEFARRINVDYIQLDSEVEAVGFWLKMGHRSLDKVYYKNKTAMIKEV